MKLLGKKPFVLKSWIITLTIAVLGIIFGILSALVPFRYLLLGCIGMVLFIALLRILTKGPTPLLLSLVIFIPLLPKIPLFGVPGSPVGIRLDDILLLVLVSAWLVYLIVNKQEIPVTPLHIPIFVFLSISLISTLIGVLNNELQPLVAFFYFARKIEYLFAFFIAISTLKRSSFPLVMRTIILVSWVVAIFGILQLLDITGPLYQYTQAGTEYGPEFYKYELVSTFAGNYDLAAYFLLIIPLILCLLFAEHHDRYLPRWLLFIILLSDLFIFIAAEARTPLVAMIVVIMLFVIIRESRLFYYLIPLLFVFPFLLDKQQQKKILDAIATLKGGGSEILDASLGLRFTVQWPRALEAFRKNPVFGSGLSSVGTAVDGNYFRILAETGILGILAFFWIIFAFIRVGMHIFTNKKINPLLQTTALGIFLGIIGILVDATFIDILESSKIAMYFWLFVGILMWLHNEAHELS